MTERDADDPFAPENDPYPPKRAEIGRRSLLRLGFASPAMIAGATGAASITGASSTGCAGPRRLVCAPQPGDGEHCTHRFCRYHEG